ncbi:phage baseplate protein [Allorhizobium ampelinum]|uniref:phage baseplate protein n=1 Tax=Allorhizobium ampelinum TaxID=3025782 RepID=UPI000B4062E3|nr:hypothetical protein [Allorhizobium ampelinum]NTA27394.1 hypothetical protein [Allorhizobium ampelinum]OVE94449.1 hypothetical protein B7W85_12930 [Allorhizobium ampelinum]
MSSLLDDAYALIPVSGRLIGTIVPDVAIEETHRDNLVVTDHPVERGAAISDHAFLMPVELEMRVGFSNSTAGYQGYAKIIYELFLSLQQSRTPFSVYTGKRAYSNMLIRSLETTTTAETENAIILTVGLREVIIVSTTTTSASNSSMSSAAKTGSVSNSGTKQLQSSGFTYARET